MKIATLLLVLTLVALGHQSAGAQTAMQRRVAVTFDDLPTTGARDKDDKTRRRLTLQLLAALTERAIPAIGFVNEQQLMVDGQVNERRVDLLRLWLAAGFDLGNHSYSHPDLHRVALADFQQDVLRGEIVTRKLLAERGTVPKYFRHPFLHTGTSIETKLALEQFLADHGYRVAPVSIDNSEWIFSLAYDRAVRAGDEELAARIGTDYVRYMLQMVYYYEDQSQQLFERNIDHVLLLHANALNSAWFGNLADQLEIAGYTFISLDDALTDVAYQLPDSFTGPGGITWIHRWAITMQADPAIFRGEPETPQYIRDIAEQPEHRYPTPAAEDPAEKSTAPPDWYLDEIAKLTAGTGRWVADNSEYKSDAEAFEAYATEWISEFGGTTMRGRLFGFVDERETPNFWEFRQYWHAGRREVIVEQFGYGNIIGVGRLWQDGEMTKSDQTFYYANGTSDRTGHESHFTDDDTYVTKSFNIKDGQWLLRREYTWHRVSRTEPSSGSPAADRS